MTIKCTDSAGFCFGVKRAVDTVYDLLAKENHKVYTLGPIIHNEQVVEDLASQGVQVIEHPDESGDFSDSFARCTGIRHPHAQGEKNSI